MYILNQTHLLGFILLLYNIQFSSKINVSEHKSVYKISLSGLSEHLHCYSYRYNKLKIIKISVKVKFSIIFLASC
jgi:hypothetical protein